MIPKQRRRDTENQIALGTTAQVDLALPYRALAYAEDGQRGVRLLARRRGHLLARLAAMRKMLEAERRTAMLRAVFRASESEAQATAHCIIVVLSSLGSLRRIRGIRRA